MKMQTLLMAFAGKNRPGLRRPMPPKHRHEEDAVRTTAEGNDEAEGGSRAGSSRLLTDPASISAAVPKLCSISGGWPLRFVARTTI
jgi:hypothetical protein